LFDGEIPVAKAKIIHYPAIESGEHNIYLYFIYKGSFKIIAMLKISLNNLIYSL
jgi:hypothetical protein